MNSTDNDPKKEKEQFSQLLYTCIFLICMSAMMLACFSVNLGEKFKEGKINFCKYALIPSQLKATVKNGQVLLNWKEPILEQHCAKVVGYRAYRDGVPEDVLTCTGCIKYVIVEENNVDRKVCYQVNSQDAFGQKSEKTDKICVNPCSKIDCYSDQDGDGIGHGKSKEFCNKCPQGWSRVNTDCSPKDPNSWRDSVCYEDMDGDGCFAIEGELKCISEKCSNIGWSDVKGNDCNDKKANYCQKCPD